MRGLRSTKLPMQEILAKYKETGIFSVFPVYKMHHIIESRVHSEKTSILTRQLKYWRMKGTSCKIKHLASRFFH
jgi:hypothetical protein